MRTKSASCGSMAMARTEKSSSPASRRVQFFPPSSETATTPPPHAPQHAAQSRPLRSSDEVVDDVAGKRDAAARILPRLRAVGGDVDLAAARAEVERVGIRGIDDQRADVGAVEIRRAATAHKEEVP